MYDALLKVATGFRLVFYGLMTVLVAAALLVVGTVVFAAVAQGGGRPLAPPAGMLLFIRCGAALMVIGVLIDVIGRLLCLAVPSRAGSAKPIIIASIALQMVYIGCALLNALNRAGGNRLPPLLETGVTAIGGLSGLVAAILFVLFIRALARYMRKPSLAARAFKVLKLCGGAVVCYAIAFVVILLGALVGAGRGMGDAVGMVVGCFSMLLLLTVFVILLVAFVLYAMLLHSMASAVRDFARRNRARYEDEEDEEGEDEDEEGEDDDDDEYDRRRRRISDDDDPRPRWR